MQSRPDAHWRTSAIGLALVAFLIGVYFFTFNGYAISRDEWFLFDATESLARRGDLRVNYEFDAYPPQNLAEATPPPADTEPMQPLLAVPLFWAAERLPGIGLAQTVWLFNVLVTALTAGMVYVYGVTLGYRVRAATLVALVFGLGTIVWPYSRTFFREPLFTLLALLSARLVRRVRTRLTTGERPLLAAFALVLALTGALFSKEATILILPVIAIEALPARVGHVRLSRRTVTVLAAMVAVAVALSLATVNADRLFGVDASRYAFLDRLTQARDNFSDAAEGVQGYMFSPARSLWVFSPVLLLGLLGWRRLWREHRWRELAMPLVMLLGFTLGYALVRGPEWYGGLGWGSRYLVPVTPFLALWLLPVCETLLEANTRRWWRVGALLVVALSVGIQILGVLVPITDYPLLAVEDYYGVLDAEQVVPWQEGAWEWRWSPISVSLDLLGSQKVDLAWAYTGGAAWILPLLATALAAAALAWMLWWARRSSGTRRVTLLTSGSLAIVAAIALGGGLYAIREDPRYYGDFAPAHSVLDQLERAVQPGDAIMLNDYTYNEFFMNYYKRSDVVVTTLPQAPGERFSQDQAPQVESPNPDELVHLSDSVILGSLAGSHERLWLVLNSSPFIEWSVRPVERYLSRHYFPVSDSGTELKPPPDMAGADTARAVLFDMTPAPPVSAAMWPEHAVDAAFGQDGFLRLVGCDLPGGTTLGRGEVLPVSLLWEASGPVPEDYTVGMFLMAADGALVAQRNAFPLNGFEHTRTWETGSLHRDNHGLFIPSSTPPGTYELWVVLYWWQQPAPEDRLPVTRGDGTPQRHVVLTTITVE